MRAASSTLGLGLCLIALGCAGQKPKLVAGSTIGDDATGLREEPTDAGLDQGDAGASSLSSAGEDNVQTLAPAVDPAVAEALVVKSAEAAPAGASSGLRFAVIELGAELPWAFAVVNRGSEAALVDFDARLLTLEITLPEVIDLDVKRPGKRGPKPVKPVLCRLPADIVPGSVDSALAIKLEPGDGLVQNFDPRLYCVGKAPWPLVPGAQVKPRFGWPPKLKVSWRGGKREETVAVQSEPFVAEPSEAEGSLPGRELEAGERRLKELTGTPFTLGSEFGSTLGPPTPASPPGLELSIAGSDAANESAVTVTTSFTNRGPRKQDLYFRRELISYEVSGPDGNFHCDPEPDLRAPADRSAVQTLRPGGKSSAVTRLIEMCPAGAFARPGLYLVHARFDAADPGTELGFKGFMGRLVSKQPALVRVRHGALPFTPAAGMMRVQAGR